MLFNKSKYNQDWDLKTLNQLGEFNRGKSKHRPRDDKRLFENGKYPFVQTGDVKAANLFITKHSELYGEFGLKQSKLWDENTLCITIAANIAETALLSYPMCFPDSVVGFVAYENESSELFMHYVFTYIKKAIQNSASGSIQDNINIDYLTSLKFRIPKKEYQDKIVKILSSLDSKIELNNKINAELEAMAKTLYDYWFVQFDFPDSDGKPYKTSGGKMVWNDELKREIPDGWETVKMSEWIDIDKSGDWGKEEPEGNFTQKVICFRGADINGLNGLAELKPPARYILEKNAFKILKSHDLIIEISGGSPTQSTGRLAFITDATIKRFEHPLICSNFCKPVSMKNKKLLYNFVYYWNSLYDGGVFFGYEGKTSGIKNLLLDSFVSSYYTVVPDEKVVNQFYDIMENLQEKKQTALAENQNLSELRDWLLPMLMNGQVRVGE
jgi:type I restriction enzyme S subunit